MWERLIELILSLFRTGRPAAPEGDEIPASLRPRVLLITFNPTIRSEGDQRLTEVLGWYDVNELCRSYIADLKECSDNLLEYRIVEQILVDDWPVKVDGFCYDETTFLACWRSQSGWHQPDTVDYEAIISRFDLLHRVESRQIDEVWVFAFPYAGLYESLMVGPDAFWCNAPPLLYHQGISRRFIIMGFNFERDVGPMLESFGHRVEFLLQHAWHRYSGEENLWEQFIRYDKIAPGRANCGWMHYAPNSLTDYDWGNRNRVPSNCDDWLNFPNFRGIVREVDCSEWGDGDMRAHHKWWLRHLPKAPGSTRGIANNWWWLGVDPNAAP